MEASLTAILLDDSSKYCLTATPIIVDPSLSFFYLQIANLREPNAVSSPVSSKLSSI
jgi:hypothetical protein